MAIPTGIRWRVLLVAATCLLPVFALTLYDAWTGAQEEIRDAHDSLRVRATTAAAEMSRDVAVGKRVLQMMGQVPEIADVDSSGCSARLALITSPYEQIGPAYGIRMDGMLVCSITEDAIGINVADREYFKKALSADGPVIGDSVRSRRQQGMYVLPIVRARRDDTGQPTGVLLVGIDLTQFAENRSAAWTEAGTALTIHDARGRIAFRWPEPEKWLGKIIPGLAAGDGHDADPSASVDVVDVDGVSRVQGVAPIGNTGLRLVMSVPTDVLLDPHAQALRRNVAALALISLIGLVVAWLVGELVVRRRLLSLTRVAATMAGGDLAARCRRPYSKDEIGLVEQSLDTLADTIASKIVALKASDVSLRSNLASAQQAQAKAEALLIATPDPVVIVDWHGLITVVNARTEAVFGFMPEELVGQPIGVLVPTWSNATDRTLPSKGARRATGVRRDGSELPVEISFSPLKTADGTLILSTITDVSSREIAERKLGQQLEHMNLLDRVTRSIGERMDLESIYQVVVRTIEESLPADLCAFALLDTDLDVLRLRGVGTSNEALVDDLSSSTKRMFDLHVNGLARCMAGTLVYEPDLTALALPFPQWLCAAGLRSAVLAPLRSESSVHGVLFAARRGVGGFQSAECEFMRQLGEHVGLAFGQARLHDELQKAYDDLKTTQQAVMQEERLRALGQMASGIAHDINNALSPVSIYTDTLLETEEGLSERARGYLVTIQRAVEDVAQTVARMREFYRKREVQLELTPVDLSEMVRQVLALTRARWSNMPQEFGFSIDPVIDLGAQLPKIMGVESDLREALTNLIFNAVDAMSEGGTLTLRTRLLPDPAGAGSDMVAVEVTDSGIGMDDVTRRRCLEPFFTTKGERGTGLGLAMVFGTVERHSALLTIDSAPGVGTTVRIAFAVPTTIAVEPARQGKPAFSIAPLRLLLVDDDPVLLKSLRDALMADGHTITVANGGAEGIASFGAAIDAGQPFDAVVTDLGMPHVDGRKVALAIKAKSSVTPVIMLTGWGQRLVAEGDIPPGVDRVLAKPPKMREIRETLSALMQPELEH